MEVSAKKAIIWIMAIIICLNGGAQIGFIYGNLIKPLFLCMLFILLLLERYLEKSFWVGVLVSLVLLSNFQEIGLVNHLNLANFTLTIFFLGFLSKETLFELFTAYSKVIIFLIAASIPFFIVQILYFDLIAMIPVTIKEVVEVGNTGYNYFHNAILYTANINQEDFRNRSIFWEPGVFQFHMVLAFYWTIYFLGKTNVKTLAVFCWGFLTCLSTSGILSLPILLLGMLEGKNRKGISTITVGIVMLALIVASIVFWENLLEYTIKKFTSENISYFDRTNSMLENFKIFKVNPILGIGIQRISISMSGLFESLYLLGGVFTFLMCLFMLSFFSKISPLPRLVLFLIWINSEAMAFTYISILVTVFGIKSVSYSTISQLVYRSINRALDSSRSPKLESKGELNTIKA